uniref:HAP1 N-terminal domain-containing protein n=1 Tax=Caenorhabditis tropicalis TaxID=1561998 RepID=A0A1I7USQ0_9PELO
MSIDRGRSGTMERRQRLHDLVDLREELRDLQANLEHEELRFADAVKQRSSIMNRNDQEDSEDEDHFLESLRITEENIHHHRQKIMEIQGKIIDKKESILSLEILVKLEETR